MYESGRDGQLGEFLFVAIDDHAHRLYTDEPNERRDCAVALLRAPPWRTRHKQAGGWLTPSIIGRAEALRTTDSSWQISRFRSWDGPSGYMSPLLA